MKIVNGNCHTINKNVSFIWQIALQLAYDIDTLYAACIHCHHPLNLELLTSLQVVIDYHAIRCPLQLLYN